MRLQVRFVFVILCCAFVHYGAAAQAEAQYLNPKILEKKVTIHSAALLPAKVEITKESAKGSEMMVAESADISSSVMEAVGHTLQQKKINVVANQFEPGSMDDSRKYQLADIQTRYDALLPKLVDKSKDVKKARFTLGDEVMLLNVHKDADVLVFIRGQGRMFTKGKTAFSIINIFDLDFPFATITVGIVDARSGEVLAFTKPMSASKVLKDKKALNKMIEKSLKKLPATAAP
ncbi:MAG TPA: hypothetical protein VE980_07680 [Pyrinomonadaceae bacterium]|nr:hypothetical protein [Pyrinomonadaceae bacterium]